MKRSIMIPAVFLALATSLPAAAQTVTVTVKGVHSAQGNVLANLCGDPTAKFPGPCLTHVAMGKAEKGDTTLSFDHVPDGRYALQIFHDEDGNFSPNIPKEGTAFSNDAAWPVTFDTAAFAVKGDTSITVTMVYLEGETQ